MYRSRIYNYSNYKFTPGLNNQKILPSLNDYKQRPVLDYNEDGWNEQIERISWTFVNFKMGFKDLTSSIGIITSASSKTKKDPLKLL